MHRRTFLRLLGAAGALGAAGSAILPARAANDRLTWWDPAAFNPDLAGGKFVALEWRYLAGRITAGDDDFGFVVSIADYNAYPGLPGQDRFELLVMRQAFTGNQAHATTTYRGTLSYDAATTSYSFVGDNPAIRASWRLDTAAQQYTLSVSTPELALSDLLISPIGDLIQEGGVPEITSGSFTLNGLPMVALSDYYADWVTLSLGGSPVGIGRFDMQTIRPRLALGAPPSFFSHHWFALAAILEDDSATYVSGWQIVSGGGVAWAVTVAAGAGASWQASSIGSDKGFGGAQPIDVQILAYQPIPNVAGQQQTGVRWRFQAGQAAPGDLLDLDLVVPPGQFIRNARVSEAARTPMQEAVATGSAGRVGGKAITSTRLTVVESTYAEGALRLGLPKLRR
jgi:hypothetical protein